VKIDTGGHIGAEIFHFLKSAATTLPARKLLRQEGQLFLLFYGPEMFTFKVKHKGSANIFCGSRYAGHSS
jgi:hypothetical protein